MGFFSRLLGRKEWPSRPLTPVVNEPSPLAPSPASSPPATAIGEAAALDPVPSFPSSNKNEGPTAGAMPPLPGVTVNGRELLAPLKCGGCGETSKESLLRAEDKKRNSGYLCAACGTRYAALLQPASIRNFWLCGACGFRVLAGTEVDAKVDALGSRCPHCSADVNFSLVNISDNRPVGRGLVGEPVEASMPTSVPSVPSACGRCRHQLSSPYYRCAKCGNSFCNSCALGAGRLHPTATVACPRCETDIRAGRTF